MWKSERSPRWFSTEMNCSADGRYFTSTRYSCSSPLSPRCEMRKSGEKSSRPKRRGDDCGRPNGATSYRARRKRSEEHTSELQSQSNLVCRLLLEKKKRNAHGHSA